jgi:hypothetical protein
MVGTPALHQSLYNNEWPMIYLAIDKTSDEDFQKCLSEESEFFGLGLGLGPYLG